MICNLCNQLVKSCNSPYMPVISDWKFLLISRSDFFSSGTVVHIPVGSTASCSLLGSRRTEGQPPAPARHLASAACQLTGDSEKLQAPAEALLGVGGSQQEQAVHTHVQPWLLCLYFNHLFRKYNSLIRPHQDFYITITKVLMHCYIDSLHSHKLCSIHSMP